MIYKDLIRSLDDAANRRLFDGEGIGPKTNIMEMIAGFDWVNRNAITRNSEPGRLIKIEMLSCGVKAL